MVEHASYLISLGADIGRATGLNFILKLLPSGDDQVLFFCSSPLEATNSAKCGSSQSQGSEVSLYKRNELINTFDLGFEGWISIRGLPFNCGIPIPLVGLQNIVEGLWKLTTKPRFSQSEGSQNQSGHFQDFRYPPNHPATTWKLKAHHSTFSPFHFYKNPHLWRSSL